MKRIIYIVFVLVALINTASAESGTLTVTSSTSGFNTEFLHAGASLNTNFSMIYFLNGTYNGIASFTLHGSGFSNAPGGHQAETTHFTVIRGGSGDGYVSYNNLAKRIDWLPTTPLVITEGPVVFEYDHNIFANITFQAKNTLCSAPLYTLDATHPITFTAVGDPTKCLGEGGGVYQYDYDVRTTVNNDYVITYPAAGLFKTQILKAGETVNSKIAILNFTTVLFQESSFNTESFEYITSYNNGIKLSLETSATLFNNVTVNSTGTFVVPNYGSGGSQNGQMNFDTVQPYFKGYFGINVTMNSTTFDPNKRYFIDVFDPSGKEKAGFPIEISSASYITGRNWVFSDYGLWNATLTNCNQFNFLCGAAGFSGLPPSYQQLIDCVNNPLCGTRSNLVDIAVQVINVSEYTYSITSDATNYATGDTIYFNISSTNPVGAYFTILDPLGNVVNPLANNVLIGQGTTLYNVTIPTTVQNGNYTAILALNTGYYAQVKAYMFSIGVVSGRDSISWGDNNIFGYTNLLSWSNGNNSNYITVSKMLNNTLTESDNFTVSNLSSGSKPYLMDTVGFWSAKLFNTTTFTAKYANISVFDSSVGLCNTKLDDFICFNNRTYNPGDPYTINYQMNTISDCLLSGPCIDPYSKIVIKVINPNGAIIFNKTLADCSGSIAACYVNKPLIGSLKSLFKASDAPGTYQVRLIYSHRDRQNLSTETIEDIIASNTAILVSKPIATPLPPTGAQGTTAMGNNLLTFIYVPAFWGAILWFSVVVISASSGTKNAMGNTGVVALVSALLFSVVGLFDPYRWFVLAGLIVIAGIYFMVGRKVTTGE